MGGIVGVGSGSATGTNVSVTQSGGNTVMSWVWESGVGGSSSRAGISMSGPTYVVWSVGVGSVFTDSPLPAMGTTSVSFVNVAATPSVSPTPLPSAYAYNSTLSKKAGLTLYWNVNGGTYSFKAVLTQRLW